MGWKITVISRIFCSTKNKVVTQKLHYFLGENKDLGADRKPLGWKRGLKPKSPLEKKRPLAMMLENCFLNVLHNTQIVVAFKAPREARGTLLA